MKKIRIFLLVMLFVSVGCQSTSSTKLSKQIATNSEAKSAVQTITNTMQGHTQVKYCPVDGKRFASNLKFCPEHHVELKELE